MFIQNVEKLLKKKCKMLKVYESYEFTNYEFMKYILRYTNITTVKKTELVNSKNEASKLRSKIFISKKLMFFTIKNC
jgi:hypothetical protein